MHSCQAGRRDLPNRGVGAGDSGVVDQDIDRAKSVAGVSRRPVDPIGIRDVDLDAACPCSQRLDGPGQRRRIPVPQADRRPGSDQPRGYRKPDPLAATGDDGASAVQIDLVHSR